MTDFIMDKALPLLLVILLICLIPMLLGAGLLTLKLALEFVP